MNKMCCKYLQIISLFSLLLLTLGDRYAEAAEVKFALPPVYDPNPPIANASEDRVVVGERGIKVLLDGFQSQNADTYSWLLLEVPNDLAWKRTDVSEPTVASPYFRPRISGVYRFGLYAIKNDPHSSSFADVRITYREPLDFSVNVGDLHKHMEFIDHRHFYTVMASDQVANLTGEGGPFITELNCFNRTTGKNFSGTITQDGNFDVMTKFIFENVEFVSGDNRLEIVVSDDLGSSKHELLWVTCNAPAIRFDDIMNIDLKPDVKRRGEAQESTFTLTTIYDKNLPEKFDVYEVDKEGRLLRKVAELFPRTPEYVYNGSFIPPSDVERYYRAVYDSGDIRFQTSIITHAIVLGESTEELAEKSRAKALISAAVNKEFPLQFEESVTRLELERRVEAIAKDLSNTPGIKSVTIGEAGTLLTVVLDSGQSLNHSFGRRKTIPQRGIEILNFPPPPANSPSSTLPSFLKQASLQQSQNLITSKNFLSLHPFLWQPGNGHFDPYFHGSRLLRESLAPKFTSTVATNDGITMQHYRDGLQYPGIVMISSHGTDEILLSGVRLLTEEDREDEKRKLIHIQEDDILIEEELSDSYYTPYTSSFFATYRLFRVAEEETVIICPQFFSRYTRGKNILFFAGWCNSLAEMERTAFWNALKTTTATYVGFTDYVRFDHMGRCSKVFFNEMLAGKSVGEATDSVIRQVKLDNGANIFSFVGNANLRIIGPEYYTLEKGYSRIRYDKQEPYTDYGDGIYLLLRDANGITLYEWYEDFAWHIPQIRVLAFAFYGTNGAENSFSNVYYCSSCNYSFVQTAKIINHDTIVYTSSTATAIATEYGHTHHAGPPIYLRFKRLESASQ